MVANPAAMARYGLALLLFTGCILPDNGPAVQIDEVLRNGDFEEIDNTGWIKDWQNLDGNPSGEIVVVTDPVASGSHALHWHLDAGSDGWEYFVIQDQIDPALLVPGVRYELTGLYRIDHLGGDISFNYIVRGEGDEPNIGNDWDNTHPGVENAWLPFRFEFTVPRGASPSNYSVYLHLIKWNDNAPLNLWVDNVSLHSK